MTDRLSPTKLPLWRTIAVAYATTFRELPQLIRIVWLWLIVLSALIAASTWLLWDASSSERTVDWAGAVGILGSIVAASSMAVAWHRLVLKDEHVDSSYLRLDRVVVRYIVYSVLFYAVLSLPFMPFVLFVPPHDSLASPSDLEVEANAAACLVCFGLPALFLIGFLVAGRLALVLPGIALGDGAGPTFAEAWRRTRNNTWRLLVGGFATALPLLAAVIALPYGSEIQSGWEYAVTAVAVEVLGATLGMVAITYLSLAYRHFFGEHR